MEDKIVFFLVRLMMRWKANSKDKDHIFKYSLTIVLGSRYLKMKGVCGRIDILLCEQRSLSDTLACIEGLPKSLDMDWIGLTMR